MNDEMSPADAARLVLSGDDGWTLLAEDPAYDTRYGAAVRVLAQHVLDLPESMTRPMSYEEDEVDPCVEDWQGVCHAPGHDWHEKRKCGAFHPEYGFTCRYLPAGHGDVHFDSAGGWWTKAGQVSSPAKPTTPEVVTGEEAAALPDGSVVAPCGPGGVPIPFDGVALFIGELDDRHVTAVKCMERWRVLYRAPEPSKPLAVGDIVQTESDWDRVPAGAAVRGANGGIGQVGPDHMPTWLGGSYDNVLPARVLDLSEVSS